MPLSYGSSLAGILFINPNAANTVGWLINGSGRLLMLFSLLAVLPALFFNKWRKVRSLPYLWAPSIWFLSRMETLSVHFQRMQHLPAAANTLNPISLKPQTLNPTLIVGALSSA